MKYFGTDGIRNVYGKVLTCELAFKVGNAITKVKPNAKVIIATDTRQSREVLKSAVVSGINVGGGSVYDVGILPTPSVSYLVSLYNADYGIVISASHNEYMYNGIKFFNSEGTKLIEKEEAEIEKAIDTETYYADIIGTCKKNYKMRNDYLQHLKNIPFVNLQNLKIVIDCANGATSDICKLVYKGLGAKVQFINTNYKKNVINDNCGCLHIENLQKAVLKAKANLGFAYDGDGDRIIACDENGNVVDGDKLIYVLGCYYKKLNIKNYSVVGTILTNVGIEEAFKQQGIKMERTDVGDKHISDLLKNKDCCALGGEQAGHIIVKHLSKSGDGILISLVISSIVAETNKKLSELSEVVLHNQVALNYVTEYKNELIKNNDLQELVKNLIKEEKVKIVLRCSGTEPKIRVMVESLNEATNKSLANRIINYIKYLESSIKNK